MKFSNQKNNKMFVKGSSLIETVISITIITICSLIATLVYTSVINQTPILKKYEYEYEVEKLINKTITEKDYTYYKKKFEGFTIEKKVTNETENKQIKSVTFIITSKNKTINFPLKVINDISDEKN